MTTARQPSPAEEFDAFLRHIRTRVQRIRSTDQHDTHAFVEDKDACARLLDRAQIIFRTRFGASPSRIVAGTVQGPKGRSVVVERRKRGER